MDRREFMKGIGAAGSMVAGLTAMNGLAAGTAQAGLFGGGNATASRKAMHAILDAIREVESNLLTPKNGFTDPAELAEAERTIGHILQTGLEFWLEAERQLREGMKA